MPRPTLQPRARDRFPCLVEVETRGRHAHSDDEESRPQELLHDPVAFPVPEKHQNDEQQIAALVKQVGAKKAGGRRHKEAHKPGKARIADADGSQDEHPPMRCRVAAHQNAPWQQHGHAKDPAEGDGKKFGRQSAGSLQVQSLPTQFRPGRDHNHKRSVAGRKPAQSTMQADIAGFDQEHQRRGSQQPDRGGDGMYVDDRGYGWLLMKVVMQIEAEADANEDPEDSQPDQRSPAIVARGPGCGSMDMHPLCPPCQAENVQRWPEQQTGTVDQPVKNDAVKTFLHSVMERKQEPSPTTLVFVFRVVIPAGNLLLSLHLSLQLPLQLFLLFCCHSRRESAF